MKKVRLDSSAGGAFTAIATVVLQKGGVVFGAAYDENFHVQHTYVETVDELKNSGTANMYKAIWEIPSVW